MIEFKTNRWKPCDNLLCDFVALSLADYCCAACGLAHSGRYEIHERGPLAHGCEQRREVVK